MFSARGVNAAGRCARSRFSIRPIDANYGTTLEERSFKKAENDENVLVFDVY